MLSESFFKKKEMPLKENLPEKNWLARLKAGLSKTSSQLSGGITSIFTQRKLDDAAIDALATRFRACTLPRSEWTHAAHFAVALWLLRHHPDLANAEGMAPMIRAYNDSVGTPNTDSSGYHHTITVASLRLAAFLAERGAAIRAARARGARRHARSRRGSARTRPTQETCSRHA